MNTCIFSAVMRFKRRKNAEIAASYDYLLCCNERLALIRAVIELQPFEHASRKGKICAIKCTKPELAVTCFFQVLHDRIFLKRPQLDHNNSMTQSTAATTNFSTVLRCGVRRVSIDSA